MLHVLDRLKILKASMIVTQLCLTLCNPLDCSLPGSSVREISQARILKWISGLPFPSPGDLPKAGIKCMSLVSPALVGGFFTPVPRGKPVIYRTRPKRAFYPLHHPKHIFFKTHLILWPDPCARIYL